ncbi:hypothetical protein TWF102_006150 [Orbilia oligospora]|uniref:F-box domain-containing protein n=1 Tax=Orbilia oligospora TaxID=2813651 RepID=A0A7C8NX14_ORBOL|nr:hypothetical protein TWF706_009508 [Orbilia oligospora]KAF3098159.1 hypothetical protein TWF102_006150 [Orbilia oligospora]KAF3132751.1 hypothetical protein TWF703_007217 [Orbilia oligospora]KAF3151370.1 hypothetical protein TWF594_007018 [Orbilia oligospora]
MDKRSESPPPPPPACPPSPPPPPPPPDPNYGNLGKFKRSLLPLPSTPEDRNTGFRQSRYYGFKALDISQARGDWGASRPDIWNGPRADVRWPTCLISKRLEFVSLRGLDKPLWDKILSYLPQRSLMRFSLVSRASRFLAVKPLFEFAVITPVSVQGFKRESPHLRRFLKHIKIELTDMRWARHFFFEIREYPHVTRLELHFILHPWVEATTIIGSLRELSRAKFFQCLTHLILRFEYKEKTPWGHHNWYLKLPKDQQDFFGDPVTTAQASNLIGLSIPAPPALKFATIKVDEGLGSAGIYYKFLSMAPKLSYLDIEEWMPPSTFLSTEPAMFPNVSRLRIGLKEYTDSLPSILEKVAENFPNLHRLQIDGFGHWWGYALRGDCVYPSSLDPIIKLKKLRDLVLPCPPVLGPNKADMKSIDAIYRLCPKELNELMNKWYESGVRLTSAIFDGFFIHPRGTVPDVEYFELSCFLETKLSVKWTHQVRPSEVDPLTAHGKVPCSTGSGVRFPL